MNSGRLESTSRRVDDPNSPRCIKTHIEHAMAARARQTGDSNKPSGPLTRYGPLYVCAVAAVALLVTLARAFQQDQLRSGGWGCEMSWMTPAYVPVLWEQPPSTKYRLYLYREQGWDLSDKVSTSPWCPGSP